MLARDLSQRAMQALQSSFSLYLRIQQQTVLDNLLHEKWQNKNKVVTLPVHVQLITLQQTHYNFFESMFVTTDDVDTPFESSPYLVFPRALHDLILALTIAPF